MSSPADHLYVADITSSHHLIKNHVASTNQPAALGTLLWGDASGLPSYHAMSRHLDVIFTKTYAPFPPTGLYYTGVLIYRKNFPEFVVLATGVKELDMGKALLGLYDTLADELRPLMLCNHPKPASSDGQVEEGFVKKTLFLE